MTRKTQNILIAVIAAILIVLVVIVWNGVAKADDSDSKQIANYEYQMNELRKQKEQCYNNLTLAETQDYLSGLTKPCENWDEEIMEIRAKADELKAKSYDLGLN